MIIAPDPSREAERLDALHQLHLLDTPPSEAFDRIARMASHLFDLPISAVSLTDRDRQWFKSRVGVAHDSIPRERAPCAQVAETRGVLVVPDLLADPFYAGSVLAGTGARFYAGAPLVTSDGHGLGALCVIGAEPRTATDAEIAALVDLAAMVMAQIELQHAFGRIAPSSGLPNATQFHEDMADLARDTPGRRRLAVVAEVAGADEITELARVMGPGQVEDLVGSAARAFRAALTDGRKVYHVADAQFAFLAPDGVDDGYLAELERAHALFRTKANLRLVATPAFGVRPFELGNTDTRDVLRTACGAAQDARATEQPVGIHSETSDAVHRRRYTLLRDFEEALRSMGQLRLVFQPRVDMATGGCVGAEALLRWQHPELGEISPGEFIPVIERSALARPTTHWVLDAALAQLAEWRAAGRDLAVSANVSAVNLDEEDFAARVRLLLLKHRVRPEALELEVTESAVMRNTRRALEQLAVLREIGIKVAIDDFGTGQSSLAYLQRLPADVVKVDQSFIRAIANGERERTLVRLLIGMARELGFRVVAEGVETPDLVGLLAEMRCDEAQGFLFARPMDARALELWLMQSASLGTRDARAA